MENPGEGRAINWAHSINPTHLPPKAPSTILDSSNSLLVGLTNRIGPCKHQHQRTPSASIIPQLNLSWIDNILEFPDSSTKIGSHRRSASDSVAVLDPSSNSTAAENAREAGRLVSAVPNSALETWTVDKRIVNATSDNPSTPSDSNSVNEVSNEDLTSGSLSAVRSDPEVQSVSESDCSFQIKGDPAPIASNMEVDTTMDPKRAKRILANRQSAQRSRVRKLQYMAELERNVNALQIEVTKLTPQVSYLDHQRVILNMDNNTLKQRIAALIQDTRFKDAHNDALKREVQRLRLILQQYQQQQFSKHDHELPVTTQVRLTSDAFNGFLKSGNDILNGSEIATVEGIGMSPLEAKSLLAQSYSNLNSGNGKPGEDTNVVDECGQLPADFIAQNLWSHTN